LTQATFAWKEGSQVRRHLLIRSLLSKDEITLATNDAYSTILNQSSIQSIANAGRVINTASRCSFVGLFLGGLAGHIVTLSLLFVENILSLLEGIHKSVLELGPLLVSGSLGILLVLGLLGLEGGGSLGLSVLLLLGEDLGLLLGERIELVHNGFVVKRVLLGLVVDSDVLSDFSELGLDLVGVDDSSDVSASHHGSVELVSGLLLGVGGVSSEDVVESLESILGEDKESSEVSTRGELEDVKSGDVAGVDTGEVSSGLLNGNGLISVNDERSLSHDIS